MADKLLEAFVEGRLAQLGCRNINIKAALHVYRERPDLSVTFKHGKRSWFIYKKRNSVMFLLSRDDVIVTVKDSWESVAQFLKYLWKK